MVDVSRAFSQEPPKEPLINLASIARDFDWRYKKTKKTDQVVHYCKTSGDFRTAAERAVEARDAHGKHHNHQSKVDIGARRELGRRIIQHKEHLENAIYLAAGTEYTEFDAMYDFVDSLKPKGIGPVTVYDVSVRLGAYMKIEPKSLYVHAGVQKGIEALIDVYNAWKIGGAGIVECVTDVREYGALARLEAHRLERVPRIAWPRSLQSLPADDVEDILCTYRTVFMEWYDELANK